MQPPDPMPRRSLAPHVRDRWAARERQHRAIQALVRRLEAEAAVMRIWPAPDSILPRLHGEQQYATQQTVITPPADTALRQRAERAERNAAWWYRAAMLLAGASLALLMFSH